MLPRVIDSHRLCTTSFIATIMITGAHLGNPTCHGTGCFLVSKSRSIVYPKITCQKVSKSQSGTG